MRSGPPEIRLASTSRRYVYAPALRYVSGASAAPPTDAVSVRLFSFSMLGSGTVRWSSRRSEEHTSELQSLRHLVCRLLLEKKKNTNDKITIRCRFRHGALFQLPQSGE